MKKSHVFLFLYLFAHNAVAEDAAKVWPEKAKCSARVSYIDLINDDFLTEELDQHVELKRESSEFKDASGKVLLKSKKSNLVIEFRPSFKNYELDGSPAKSKRAFVQVTGMFGDKVFTTVSLLKDASHTDLALSAQLNFTNPNKEQVLRAYQEMPETERQGKKVLEFYKKAFPNAKVLMTDAFAECSFFSFDTNPIDPGL